MSFRHALESSSDAEIWIMWTEIGKAVVDLELSCACLQQDIGNMLQHFIQQTIGVDDLLDNPKSCFW